MCSCWLHKEFICVLLFFTSVSHLKYSTMGKGSLWPRLSRMIRVSESQVCLSVRVNLEVCYDL